MSDKSKQIRLSVVQDPTETPSNLKKLFDVKYPLRLPAISDAKFKSKKSMCADVLPENQKPNFEPSKAVEAFLEEKKIKHEACINKMKNDMKSINLDVENSIRYKSETLKTYLKESAKAIADSFKMIKYAKTHKQSIFLTREDFDKVLDNIESKTSATKCVINEYYDYLKETEKGRSKQYKDLLKAAYKELHAISYQLPYPLQEFFENEIMNINEITLSNYRCYEDIHLQLQLKLENDSRLSLQEYQFCRDVYIANRKELLKKILKVDKISEDDVFTNYSEEPSNDIYNKKGEIITMDFLKNTVSAIINELITFDSYINHLKNKTCIVIEKAFERNYDEIQHVPIKFEESINIISSREIEEECFNTLFDDPLRKEITPFTQKALEDYESILQNIRYEVTQSENILTCALHIWDEHFDRIFLSKELCLVDLNHLLRMHSESEDAEIEKINICVDKLREATTETELNGYFDMIKKAYETIHKTITSNYESELAFFNKFKHHSEIDANILMSEIQVFLDKNTDIPEIDPTLQRGRGSQLEIMEKPKIALIYQFNNKLKGLKNWLYGLKEMILLALQKCEADIMMDVERWIESQQTTLERNKKMKIALNRGKLLRIERSLYKLRLSEIRQHNEQLQAHKLGVMEEISNLKLLKNKYDEKFKQIIDNCKETVENVSQRAKVVNNAHSVRYLINTLAVVKKSHLQQLEKTQEEYLQEIENKIAILKYASLQYLKSIKLFNEEGNYNGEEAKNIKNELLKLDKAMKKETVPITKEVEKSYSKVVEIFKLSQTDLENRLLDSEKELIFVEKYLAETKRVRIEIKNATFDLRKKFKVLEYYYEHLRDEAEIHSGEISYLEEFISNADYTEKAFNDLRSVLVQDKLFQLNTQIFNKEIEGSDNFYIENNLTQLVNDFKNFNAFGEPLTGKDYMSGIINLLSTSYNSLREKAKEFYKDKTTFINTGVIIDNLQDFLVTLLSKYLYYQLQCEQVWLEVSFDYLMIVDKVTKFIKNYYVESIISFLEINLAELRKNCYDIHSEIEDTNKNVENRYLQVLKKLKPLHGHPSNESLLTALNTEMEELEQDVTNVEVETAAKFENFKDNSHKNLEKITTDANQIESQLDKIINKYVSSILNDTEFLLQVRDRIFYLQNIIDKTYLLEENKSCDIIEDLNKKLNEFKKGLRITSEKSMELFNMLSKIELSITVSSTSSFASDGMKVEDIIEEYKEKQNICISKLEDALTLNDIINKWRDQWKNEVECVKRLYTVKYDSEKSKIV